MISLFTPQPDHVDDQDRRSFVRRRAIFVVLAWLLATALNLTLAHYLLPIALADSQLSPFRPLKWQVLGLVWLGSLLNVWRSAVADLLRLQWWLTNRTLDKGERSPAGKASEDLH